MMNAWMQQVAKGMDTAGALAALFASARWLYSETCFVMLNSSVAYSALDDLIFILPDVSSLDRT